MSGTRRCRRQDFRNKVNKKKLLQDKKCNSFFYAGGETRTRTSLRITDFESVVSAIPPHRLSTNKL